MTQAVLTSREREILLLFGRGWEKPEIARRLTISPHTVHNITASAREKLAARNIRHAIVLALLGKEISVADLAVDLPPSTLDRTVLKPTAHRRRKQAEIVAGLLASAKS